MLHDVVQSVPQSFWNEVLFKLVAVSCLQPTQLGFDRSEVEKTKKLQELV